MKVILLTDVKNVGKKGKVVEVSDSYARNVLIKKNQGLEATGKNMNDLKLQKANDEKVAAQNLADARVLAEQIEKSSIVLKVKVGEGGKLFGSISTKEIAEAVKESSWTWKWTRKKSSSPIPSSLPGRWMCPSSSTRK